MTTYAEKVTETEFFEFVMKDVYGPREGGAIFLVDAEDARKGVGKTAGAVALALLFAQVFDYEIQREDLVLSGDNYLDRLRNHPGTHQPSVLLWDEAVGAGSGDARRSMAEQNRVMGQAWQLLRTKRILSFVTLPDFDDLDSRLQKLADYRIYCLREPIGYFQSYFIGTPFKGKEVLTYGLGAEEGAQRIRFPDVASAGHPVYEALNEKKEELIDADSFDADDQFTEDDDLEDEDDGMEPEEVAEEIVNRDSVDAYIEDNQGQQYINRDLLKIDYDLTDSESKVVKSLLKRRLNLDVI